MKLWILRPKNMELWVPWYDKCFEIICLAKSSKQARELASGVSGDEGEEAWLDKNNSTCKLFKVTGKPKVIMYDFRNG